MAEDLSIKLKVEPDGGGVQGKLDKIAKDKKFNVQIGDKNLKTQLKSISKTISGTLEKAMANTMKAIDDYAESAQQAAGVIEQAQKREQAALISNVNLLARNAQERKEITNAIQGQNAAQNKLRNEIALTAAQENELRKRSNRDLTIRQLRAEQQEWEQLEKEISDVNNLIKEKNRAADTGSKKNNKKDDAEFTVDQKFPEVQKELLNLMTDDDAFDIGIGKSSEKASEDILTGFNLISDSIGKGKDAIRKAVAEFQGESGAGSIFDTFSYLFDVEGDYSGDIDAWIDAEIPDEKIKNALSKKFKSIITAASDDSENELSNAYNQYVNTISKLFEDYYAAIEKITNKASTTKDVEKGAKELQTVIVEIASTIGVLPDNVKEKMLANVTEPLDKVKEAIEQRKEALKNKMLGNDEQGSNDVKLKVDIDDADTEERLKNTTETIISQLDTMAQKQRDITVAKEATVKAEQSIYTETQKSIKELQTLVEQKEQLAKKISELRSEATGIPDGKGQTEDAKMLMETLSAIDPSKVKTVLDNVSAFVDSVVKSSSELETTKTKAAEFNAAIESINKTLATSIVFMTSLTKEDKTAKGKRSGKKTQKADTTEVDEGVKLQQLVLNAEKAADGFAEITAVFNSLTNAAKSITDSMTDLAKLKTMTDEVNMDQFAELINNSVDEQIKKISTKIRKDAMLQTSPDNSHVTSLAMKTGNLGAMIKQMPEGAVKDSYTKQFAELNDDITAFYNGSEKAATTWADIVSRTTEMAEGVKQVNKETQEATNAAAQVADEESESTNALLANAAKYAEFTQALDEATKFQFNNKTTENYDNLVRKLSADLSSVFDAIARFNKEGNDRNADILQAVIRQAEKDVADIKTQTVQLQELSKIDPAASISKALELDINGTESAKITRLREEFKEAQTALEKARKEYEKDWSSENFDKLKIAMDNGASAAKRLTTAVNTANDTMADNSVRSNERQFEQIKDFLANYQTMLTALQRSAGNKGFKQRDDYRQTVEALKNIVTEAEKVKSAADVPTFIAAMANNFKDAKTPIESVSDALGVVKTKIGETKAKADEFNGALKSQRDVNTYIKSVSNSLYTAQRYLSNNSKITTDPAIYARYLEYIEHYQELLKSGKITQQNGQEYASKASKEFAELKKAVQDAGLETDTLAMKFKKLFETNIKSQFASQVISMVEQGLRQIYQNVVNIDSAMTELKKVTDETDNTYDAFLDDAGTRAKNLGASISDIVTASADFARLGYNLKDSKELADAAVLYQHVGDGISSVNDASESIISTMKAFGVETKDVTSIVDKFNEVGKQHCPKFTISVKGWRHPRPRKDMEFNDNFLYGNREVIFFMCTRNNKGQFIKGTISNKRKHNKIPLLRLPYTLTAEQVEDKIVKFYKSLETAGYTWQQVC